jgi:hypothetical protein
VVLASRGLRETEQGTEAVADAAEREALRRQARGVHLRAAALAIAVTLLALLA